MDLFFVPGIVLAELFLQVLFFRPDLPEIDGQYKEECNQTQRFANDNGRTGNRKQYSGVYRVPHDTVRSVRISL